MLSHWRQGILAAALAAFCAGPSFASDEAEVSVNVTVLPYAQLTFVGTPSLYLEVPPPGDTSPISGVAFILSGNSLASISAEPDEFLTVLRPNFDLYLGLAGQYILGRAENAGNFIGYDVRLTVGSSSAALPKDVEGGTSPLSTDLMVSDRAGKIDLIANAEWTATGGLALPGLYTGTVIITLTSF